MADTSILWGASPDGVLTNLPTREGVVDGGIGRVNYALETISGLVLGRIGDVSYVPAPLTNLAAKVVEAGAAALIEQGDFPEQSTDKGSLASVLWAQYNQLLTALVTAVEALGGEPDVMMRPLYVSAPPMFYGQEL